MSVDDFFSKLNPLLRAILRSPFHWLLSPGLMLLTVTGRKTGRRYTFPVGYQQRGDRIAVLASEAHKKSWWRNLREPGTVEVLIKGRTRKATGVLIAPGTTEFKEHTERALRRVPGLARVFRVEGYDRSAGLSDSQLAALGDEIAVVEIRLER